MANYFYMKILYTENSPPPQNIRNILCHCGLVTPYGSCVNITSDNDLEHDGNKPLPEPILTYPWHT